MLSVGLYTRNNRYDLSPALFCYATAHPFFLVSQEYLAQSIDHASFHVFTTAQEAMTACSEEAQNSDRLECLVPTLFTCFYELRGEEDASHVRRRKTIRSSLNTGW